MPLALIIAVSLIGFTLSILRRKSRVVTVVLLANALFFAFGLAMYAAGWTRFGQALTLPSFLILAGLAFVFARSLARNEEPIVIRFMRLELGTVPERAADYGRTLTAVWAVLLAAMAVESLVLSLVVSLSTWSWLVNVANPALLIFFFVGQHLYGDRFLPAQRRASPLTTIKAMFHPQVWFAVREGQRRSES